MVERYGASPEELKEIEDQIMRGEDQEAQMIPNKRNAYIKNEKSNQF